MKWSVKTYSGYAGGISREARATLVVDTLADTVESIRIKVEAVPKMIELLKRLTNPVEGDSSDVQEALELIAKVKGE